jgi:hypothetical protein
VNDELVQAGRRLTGAAAAHGVTLRPIGGVGVLLHCPSALASGPHRPFGDLDMAAPGGASNALTPVFDAEGYEPDRRFNAMQGDRRMIFKGEIGKVDVFIGAFEMCHTIEFSDRLGIEPETATASDLLLTKLQVVQLNDKDVQDLGLLLGEHVLGRGAGDHVDVDYLGAVTGDDWGLWRTSTGTLRHVAELRPDIASRCNELLAELDGAPKTRRWRLRARVGERKRWYELPDEIE